MAQADHDTSSLQSLNRNSCDTSGERSSSGGLTDIHTGVGILCTSTSSWHGYCIIEWRPVGESKLPSRESRHLWINVNIAIAEKSSGVAFSIKPLDEFGN